MKNQKQLKKLISRLVKETVASHLKKEDAMNVTQDKDLKRGLESPMGFVNIGENANEAFRFIFYGANSGNVYGVSNAPTIEKAWDEFKKTTVRTVAGDVSDAEYDKAKVEFLNGYAVVEYPQSDEGTFGIIDINSTNPAVQHEIKALGLMKYAQEYLRDRSNESIAPDGKYVDDMESGMAVKKMHNLNEGQKYDQVATAMLEDFTARFLLGVKQAGAVDRPTLERVKRETITQFVKDTFYEYFPRLLDGNKIGEQSASGAAGGFATPFAFKKKKVEEVEDKIPGKFVNRGEVKLEGGLDYETAYKIAKHHWDIFGQSGKDERGVWNFQTRGNRWCCSVGKLNGQPAMLNVTTTPGRLQLLVGNELELEMNEMTSTGAVAGYQTPYAFSKKKSGSQRALDVTTKMGYKKVKDIDEATKQKI